MRYQVLMMPVAEAAIEAHVRYIADVRREPINAARVFERLQHAIRQLEYFPLSTPLAPENEHRPYEIRMKVVSSCCLLFNVDKNSRTVRIISFRHRGQVPKLNELPKLQ